jgi:hypothetical protein
VLRTNDEFRKSLGNLKGALLTAFQPLLEVVIPALTSFINLLTKAISAIASFINHLFGKTIDQSKAAAKSLYNEAAALDATGEAAEEAGKAMANFDEINRLQGSGDVATGGSAADASIEATFDFEMPNFVEEIKAMAEDVKLIFIGLTQSIRGILTGDWGLLWDGLVKIFVGARDLIIDGLGLLEKGFCGLIDHVRDKFKLEGTNMGLMLEGLKQMFQGTVDLITGLLTLDFAQAWQGTKDIVKGAELIIIGALGAIKDLFDFVIDKIVEKLRISNYSLLGWVNAIKQGFGGCFS